MIKQFSRHQTSVNLKPSDPERQETNWWNPIIAVLLFDSFQAIMRKGEQKQSLENTQSFRNKVEIQGRL